LAVDAPSGRVFELLANASLRLLGSYTPRQSAPSTNSSDCGGPATYAIGVQHAARDGTGRLWLLMGDGQLSVQAGNRFEQVASHANQPSRPARLLGSLGADMLVLDRDGVARVELLNPSATPARKAPP
jgi:hypothetical protein